MAPTPTCTGWAGLTVAWTLQSTSLAAGPADKEVPVKVLILAILTLVTTSGGVLAQDLSAISAEPATIRLVDLLRFRDQQARVFEGVGLVTGLDGSGDRLKSEDRLRPLAGVLERHDVPFLQTLDLLKTGNSALVMVQSC